MLVTDAARIGAAPGSIKTFDGADMDHFLRTRGRNPHDIGLDDMLDGLRLREPTSGQAAEAAREQAMEENVGNDLVIVDGSIPVDNPAYSCSAGSSNLDMLRETAEGAAAIIAVGTCAAFGGIPHADRHPTDAVAVSEVIADKPVIDIPGCPPIPIVMPSVIARFLALGLDSIEVDALGRPKAFFGETIDDRCHRRPFYGNGKFTEASTTKAQVGAGASTRSAARARPPNRSASR